MKRLLKRLWPKGLAGRLVILLIVALALAETTLVFILRNQQDHIVAEIVHGQALSQTVTLSRLLTSLPREEEQSLLRAFGSRESCARLYASPLIDREMTHSEQQLADLLGNMMRRVQAGKPRIAIEAIGEYQHPCRDDRMRERDDSARDDRAREDRAREDRAREDRTRDDRPRDDGPRDDRPRDDKSAGRIDKDRRTDRPPSPIYPTGRIRIASVTVMVPLQDRGWLTVRTAVAAPTAWNRISAQSFLLSCLAITLVVVFGVRAQTRSLRTLADASERLGRGEAVAPLDPSGPSEVSAAILAFNTMQERLREFMQDRLKLLAGISHDLRTPLSVLRLRAEFMDDEAMREGMIATIDELTRICEATLAFTRAEAMTEATEVVDLRDLIDAVAEPLRLTGGDVKVLPFVSFLYSCRPTTLKRALRNLAENAIRYGKRASISVTRNDHTLIISVQDEGPGLPEDRMEEAFQPFVRLEPSRNVETGGIGLGLSIARGIVKAHGGTLSLRNRPEGGLSADMSLPLAASSTAR